MALCMRAHVPLLARMRMRTAALLHLEDQGHRTAEGRRDASHSMAMGTPWRQGLLTSSSWPASILLPCMRAHWVLPKRLPMRAAALLHMEEQEAIMREGRWEATHSTMARVASPMGWPGSPFPAGSAWSRRACASSASSRACAWRAGAAGTPRPPAELV